MTKRLLLLAGLCVFPAVLWAQKKPIDESIYDSWKRVSAQQVSDYGTIVTYEIKPAVGDGMLVIHDLCRASL